MTRQALRDAKTLTRSSDPITSWHAAETAIRAGTVETHENKIRSALKEFGPMTAEEIGDKIGLSSVQVCRRLPYMCDLDPLTTAKGLEVTRENRDGKQARVWGFK